MLFLIRALCLDISATADIEGLTSSAREKFDWTVDSTSTDTFVIEEEITSGGFDAQVGSAAPWRPAFNRWLGAVVAGHG